MEDLYNRVDFIISGGALELLTKFLGSKDVPAVVLEPAGDEFHVLDAVGAAPESLTIRASEFLSGDLNVARIFPNRPPKTNRDVETAAGNEKWPCVVRMRGPHWLLFILLGKKPDEDLVKELAPYAGLIGLWQVFKRTDITEKRLSRLSYMILATKNTLASIFEPMPLQYFADFLADVMRESLFPKTIAMLRDEDEKLRLLDGDAEALPERKGIYAEPILLPTPVVTRNSPPFEVVLPVAGGGIRLFCVMTWNGAPDAEMLNFMELLGNLAARALTINSLRTQNREAEESVQGGEFTILSLSNILKILRGSKDQQRFYSMLTDVFMEQSRVSDCALIVWDKEKGGYRVASRRVNNKETAADPEILSAQTPVSSAKVADAAFGLEDVSMDSMLRSWGLTGSPWHTMDSMRWLFPICDDASLVGLMALGSDSHSSLSKEQLAELHLIAQFSAYEFRRF